jgi:hypothetical protein
VEPSYLDMSADPGSCLNVLEAVRIDDLAADTDASVARIPEAAGLRGNLLLDRE